MTSLHTRRTRPILATRRQRDRWKIDTWLSRASSCQRESDALRKAQGLGLDLVEIAPTATPPVCKIIDFGKFRYDVSKQTKDKRPSGSKLKEIKFRVNIDDHDYLTKIRHGEEFLDRGNKVRVQLQFRGREMAHQEF